MIQIERTSSTDHSPAIHIPAHIRWPAGIIALLGMSVVIQTFAIFVAHGDPSFAVEPDYEQKAANYNDVIAQRQANAALGWTASVRTSPADRPSDAVVVRVRLVDKTGDAVEGADVSFDACHVGRASKVFHSSLSPDASGDYSAELPANRSGIWEFRVTATRTGEVFTAKIRQDVLVSRSVAR